MSHIIELVGNVLSIIFFLQGFSALTYLNVLPSRFESVATDLKPVNLHFSTESRSSDEVLKFFNINIDKDCDEAAVFVMNMLAVACVFGCILKLRIFIYVTSHFQQSCKCIPDLSRYTILAYPTLEIIGFLYCFFGLSLSASIAATKECPGTVLRVLGGIVLLFLLAGAIVVRYLIARACRHGVDPPSPLGEFDSKVTPLLHFAYILPPHIYLFSGLTD
jgi:hypothetical protein